LANLFSPLKKLFFAKIIQTEDDVETFCQQAYSRNAMKTAQLFAVSLFFGAGTALPLLADDAPTGETAYEPGTAPHAASPIPRQESQGDQAAQEKERLDRDQQKDWLLRGYEEQLQARELANGQSQNNNLYAELTADKNLAKASGLTANTAPAPVTQNLRTTDAGASNLNLRTNVPVVAASAHTGDLAGKTGLQFKPLITPLGSTEVAGLHDLFEKLPALAAQNAPGPVSSDPVEASDPGALDVPGMTAAESDPVKKADLDLGLDPLPGETASQERSHHDLSLELPTSRNEEQVQQQQDTALLIPGKKKTVAPVAINPALLKPVDDTSAMVPISSPGRGQVSDPFDILR
jgi:hypothetical protein